MKTYPGKVVVYEVGPRDGLQNEKSAVPTAAKVEFINALSDAGLPFIEATSFVSPRAVPQLADAGDVITGVQRRDGTRYPVLVPNERGMQRALEAEATDVAVFTAASESFTKANINVTIAESLDNFGSVVRLAERQRVPVRGYVSTAVSCPYEGKIDPRKVLEVTQALLELGVWQVSLGDTIGVATPRDVETLLDALLPHVQPHALAVHFHDTRGTALANTLVALEMGITTIDSSAGGLGGCPFAPGASGNLATEDLVYMLDGLGIDTGVDIDKVAKASSSLLTHLGRPASSKYLQAYLSGSAA